MFAMAERSWKGIPEDGSRFAGKLPEKDTEAYQAFALFEKRMEALAGNKPFPYWRDSFVEWTVFGPVPKDRQEEVRNGLLAGKSPAGLEPVQARGGNLYFRTRAGAEGLFSKVKPGNTAWAETTFYAPRAGTMYAHGGVRRSGPLHAALLRGSGCRGVVPVRHQDMGERQGSKKPPDLQAGRPAAL